MDHDSWGLGLTNKGWSNRGAVCRELLRKMRGEIVAAHMGKPQSSLYSTEWSHLAEKNLTVLATVPFDSGQIEQFLYLH